MLSKTPPHSTYSQRPDEIETNILLKGEKVENQNFPPFPPCPRFLPK